MEPIEEWRNEHKQLVDCKMAFSEDYAISNAYHDRKLDEFLDRVISVWGKDRVVMILAHTIRHADWDGRYYPSVKDWAKEQPPVPQAPGRSELDRFYELNMDEHPVILNAAARMIIKMEQVKESQKREKEPER